jgi:hypothetical protein
MHPFRFAWDALERAGVIPPEAAADTSRSRAQVRSGERTAFCSPDYNYSSGVICHASLRGCALSYEGRIDHGLIHAPDRSTADNDGATAGRD